MQGNTIAQEQWSAIFGQEAALVLQNDTQSFEEFMAQQGRDWELADRPWQEQMWLLDAQLQMAVSGYDWLNDEYNTGAPSWMVANAEEGTSITSGSQYTTHPGGAAAGWKLGRTSPYLDADGNPTDDPNNAAGNNPDYDPNAPDDESAYDENGGYYDHWGRYHPPSGGSYSQPGGYTPAGGATGGNHWGGGSRPPRGGGW